MYSRYSCVVPGTERSFGGACQQEISHSVTGNRALVFLGIRIPAARAFAGQFSNFEWKYLCSYRWFLTGVDRGLSTGDFLPLQRRAEDELVNEGLRRRTVTVHDESRVCHSASWFD
jgi:hypothetical protein